MGWDLLGLFGWFAEDRLPATIINLSERKPLLKYQEIRRPSWRIRHQEKESHTKDNPECRNTERP